MLLWLYGHHDLMGQLKAALDKDLINGLFNAFSENVLAEEDGQEMPHDDTELLKSMTCPDDSSHEVALM